VPTSALESQGVEPATANLHSFRTDSVFSQLTQR
jgi:hypothetical protein